MASKFFKGFSKVFKGPNNRGEKAFSGPTKYATIGGVKPKAKISDATKKFKAKVEATKKAIKKGTDDFKKQNPNRSVTDKQIKQIQREQTEKSNKKSRKEFLREEKRKGGRIGFKKGTGKSGVPAMDIKSTPTKKLSEKQKKIARLAGDPRKIDKPDFAKLRNKNKKVI